MYHWLTYLPFVAAPLHALGFVLYAKQALKGESAPQIVSWGLWAFLATLNALTFRQMSDNVTALVSLTGSAGCIILFIYVLFIGKFTKMTRSEGVQLTAGVIAIFVWMNTNATIANVLLVGIALGSFTPTFRAVLKNPYAEKPAPWWLWGIAYLFTTIFTFLFRDGWTAKMIMPITLTALHGIVPFMVTERRRYNWRKKGARKLKDLREYIRVLESDLNFERRHLPMVERMAMRKPIDLLLEKRKAQEKELAQLLGM